MNYLIIGTGGVGGCIAGFLALAGKDVTCIARGKHLEAIRRQGLHLKSDLKGEHFLPVKACTAEEYQGKADVILVCVKGYSIDSIRPVLERAATPDTLVIPILNVYGTGPRIGRLVPSVKVLDGCIYIGRRGNQSDGQHLPPGVRCASAAAGGARTAGEDCRRTPRVRHQGGRVGRHQPGYVHQMVVHLGHGLHGCLSRRADGRGRDQLHRQRSAELQP